MSDLPGFFQGTEMPDATWWQALFPDPAHILTEVGLAPGMDAVDLAAWTVVGNVLLNLDEMFTKR